ncbi:MAG: glycosyltransferase family 2 protein [Deltaproteobacteria bacterium]|nr:glycosyltransferase family 2 protein [Deltaproteobacteria bacterium]
MMHVRLGGFVIHGNSHATLGRCLDSLVAVCDEVLAVDSKSNDGSRELCAARNVRSVITDWHGPGVARQIAARELSHCDYLFFLDADEWLESKAIECLKSIHQQNLQLPHYSVRRRDWVTHGTQRYLFRKETRARLVRRDAAIWQPTWIVHEALPKRATKPLGIYIEHHFAQHPEELRKKQAVYAFLWAVRAFAEGRKSRSSFGRVFASAFRDAVIKGALWRGGIKGLTMSLATAQYHGLKYKYLNAINRGNYFEAISIFRNGNYNELFNMVQSGPPLLIE